MSNNHSAPPPPHFQQPYPTQGFPPQPPPQPPRNNRNLVIVLGAIAAAVVIALVAVFVWVIPAFSKPQAGENPAPVAPSEVASEPAEESTAPEGVRHTVGGCRLGRHAGRGLPASAGVG